MMQLNIILDTTIPLIQKSSLIFNNRFKKGNSDSITFFTKKLKKFSNT